MSPQMSRARMDEPLPPHLRDECCTQCNLEDHPGGFEFYSALHGQLSSQSLPMPALLDKVGEHLEDWIEQCPVNSSAGFVAEMVRLNGEK